MASEHLHTCCSTAEKRRQCGQIRNCLVHNEPVTLDDGEIFLFSCGLRFCPNCQRGGGRGGRPCQQCCSQPPGGPTAVLAPYLRVSSQRSRFVSELHPHLQTETPGFLPSGGGGPADTAGLLPPPPQLRGRSSEAGVGVSCGEKPTPPYMAVGVEGSACRGRGRAAADL